MVFIAVNDRPVHASVAPAAPCAVVLYHQIALLDPTPADPPIASDSDDCRVMTEMRRDFLVLRAASGLSDTEVRDVEFIDGKDEPLASFPGASVRFGNHALTVFKADVDLRRTVISHELGHALQKYRSLGSIAEIPTDEQSRAYEAQADALGRDILVKAGFPANTMKKGFEAFADCGRYDDNRRSDHPSPEARVLNQDLLAQRERKIKSAMARIPDGSSRDLGGVYDGGAARGDPGMAVPAAGASPKAAMGDFNSRGILKAEHWILDDAVVPAPSNAAVNKPAADSERNSEFHAAVVAAANELINGPGVENNVFEWIHSNVPRPSDLAAWLTEQAILLALKRQPPRTPSSP